jgi:hypothetical protein
MSQENVGVVVRLIHGACYRNAPKGDSERPHRTGRVHAPWLVRH